ncbi:sulfotransferase domain-containing protein [Vannielia litorea]|uniref:sulfotransferase domain-containing protein n=1 Tax=Vannielia litorea TaxID=1217970 RepID=UPI001C94A177|nr:sulfotransferase domain-containing protein [Vannielia litorea]MBY6046768.1 sulfotransferase [Vannielia litorea]MBY6074182.1 sulfotransferase [Vannielia litorea]
MSAARFLCVGTHHKTGTVWLRRTLHRIMERQGIGLMQANRPKRIADLPESGPQIVVNWSSGFPAEFFALPEARFIHVIRDPRDVLLSGARYHEKAAMGNEKFLKEQRPEWDGLNYKDYLKSLETPQEKLLFEMEQKHASTLFEMLAWPYGHPQAVELRYEELMEDHDCALFRSALERCAIEGLDIDGAVEAFWDSSLFGGLKEKDERPARILNHVTSGTGAEAQWRSKMPRSVARIYADRYGSALAALGYAEDDSWVELCPEDVPAAQEAVGAK